MWTILKNLGFPMKIINVIKSMYIGSECCVRVSGVLSKWFGSEVWCETRRCTLTLLIHLCMNWVMRRATEFGNGISLRE